MKKSAPVPRLTAVALDVSNMRHAGLVAAIE
jgi:hypothetical protein